MADATQSASRPLELTELLTLMVEVSERINSTLDLDELMGRIAEIVKRAIDYEVFAILMLNEKTQELSVRFSIGHPDELIRAAANQGWRGNCGAGGSNPALGSGQ